MSSDRSAWRRSGDRPARRHRGEHRRGLAAFPALQRGGAGKAETFLFVPYQVARGENWLGLLLAHLSHGSMLHLAFNMLALYSFSGTVISALGPVEFMLIYVLAGLGSDLMVFALWSGDPSYRCLGASGSVFGVVMAAIVLDPRTSVAFFFAPVPIPGAAFMLGYAIVSVLLIARGHRGAVSHEGHLGGAIAGLAVTGMLAPRGFEPLVRWFSQWL